MANDRSTLTSAEREKASVFHSWSAQASINPLMVKDAEGVYVTGEDGTTYLDLSSQLVNTNIGHQHPAVVRAIQEQAATLCTIAPPARLRVALPRGRTHFGPLLRRRGEGLLHQRWDRGNGTRHPPGATLHRTSQGVVGLSQLPRRHRDVNQPDR